jgi:phage protein D
MPELSLPTGFVAAAPTLLIDGDERADLSAGLLSLIVEETSEGLYRCEARFGNWSGQEGFRYFDRQLIDFGKALGVRMPAGDESEQVFLGRITAIEAQFAAAGTPPSITVLAEDRLQDLRMARRTRVFEDMSDADAFEQIAGEHGLSAEIDVSGPTHKLLAQVNRSDLAFVRDRARWLDADVWIDDRTLHVQARGRRIQQSDTYTLSLGTGGLLEFSVTADLASQHSSVVVSGWDVAAKDSISHEADDAALGSELNGDQSGAAILQQAFGARVDRLAHHVPLTSDEARDLAEASFRAQARRFVYGTGRAWGDARLRVGIQVRISGLGPLFEGVYTVCETRHVFSRGGDDGYMTEFVVERAGLGRP